MRCEILIRPPQAAKGVFVSSVWHPHAREPEPRTPRLSEDGARTFSPELGCWVADEPALYPVKRPAAAARPVGDGSGCYWDVVSDGARLWTIEAASFEAALAEKRRLCRRSGGKSGFARLVPALSE